MRNHPDTLNQPAVPRKVEPIDECLLLVKAAALHEEELRILYGNMGTWKDIAARIAPVRAARDAVWDTIRRQRAPQAHHSEPLPEWLEAAS